MNKIRNLMLILLAGMVVLSCNKVSNKKTAGGMPYKVFPGKNGKKIYPGNFIKIHITQEIKDSVYFSTEGKLPMYMRVNEVPQMYDISEVWTMVKSGDSIISTQMMDTFIARNPGNVPPEFKKGDRIKTYIKILEVFTTDSAVRADNEKVQEEWKVKEAADMAKYISDNKINAQKTISGAYVVIKNQGDGPAVDSGKYVKVNYTGTNFQGKTFDSNVDTAFHHAEPYGYTANAGEMIKGFDEGVMLLNKGGTARIYVPSMLAYKGQPNSPNIKPYENLIFDVEVVDVMDKAPAPLQPRGIKIDPAQQQNR
jgi:FKBP-type peptidyl-prolyl cis-trans isomerase